MTRLQEEPTRPMDPAQGVAEYSAACAPTSPQLRTPVSSQPPAAHAAPFLFQGGCAPEGRRLHETDEAWVRRCLYGARSGAVTVREPRSHSFNTVESDIPPRTSLADWRARKSATTPDAAGAAA
jgi:hypothetical protein